MSNFGYAGEILNLDLSSGRIGRLPTADYAERFLGGRGIAAKIYWDNLSPRTGAFDEENCITIMTGPLAGFTRFSGCRWQISAKSPEMEKDSFSYANLGGSWGAWLKYAGYDGVAVTGKSDKPKSFLKLNMAVTRRSLRSDRPPRIWCISPRSMPRTSPPVPADWVVSSVRRNSRPSR